MCCFPLSFSSSLNKTFVICTEDNFFSVAPYMVPTASAKDCCVSHCPFLCVIAAPCSLFFFHCICVKSDLIMKEIPSKKLKWILTAVALHSASNPPIMSTASSCSRTDGLRVFMVHGTGFPIPRLLIIFQ